MLKSTFYAFFFNFSIISLLNYMALKTYATVDGKTLFFYQISLGLKNQALKRPKSIPYFLWSNV